MLPGMLPGKKRRPHSEPVGQGEFGADGSLLIQQRFAVAPHCPAVLNAVPAACRKQSFQYVTPSQPQTRLGLLSKHSG